MADQNNQTTNDLNIKRQEAARAMSSGFKKSDTTAPTINTSPEPVSKPHDSMAIAEQRLRAQMAMEGDERRKRREEGARIEREAKEQARLEEERKKKEAYEQEKLRKEKEAQLIREQEERETISKQLKQQVDRIKESGTGLKTIRTLRADTDNLIKGQNISLIGIAIKEEERRKQKIENESITSGKNLKLIVASSVLIILSLGIAFYIYQTFYSGVAKNIISGQSNLPQAIVFAEKEKVIDTTSVTTDNLISRLKNEVRNPPDLLIGQIENLQFTKTPAGGKQTPLNPSDFLTIIGSKAPDGLTRTLDKEFMFGVLSSAENAAFLIIKTESYDKGLAGLLDWEGKSMTEDMYQILTSLRPDSDLLTKPYEDTVIRNIDTRVLKDASGTIRLIYGFLDGSKNIVLAGNQQAFLEVLRRFNTPTPLKQ
ncbi:MAG: hypothetical protein HY225_01485 [Candidatus Vogelbacteria bacterium]|nr:hypothetical protein [Candidatus Vogelbacteria bacterium]